MEESTQNLSDVESKGFGEWLDAMFEGEGEAWIAHRLWGLGCEVNSGAFNWIRRQSGEPGVEYMGKM